MTWLGRTPGLRWAVTTAFALGALTLSAALAVGTYFSARHQLLDQRESSALRQAFSDASTVRDNLLTSGAQVSDVLGSIAPPAGAIIYVRRNEVWYSSSLDSAGRQATTQVQPVVSGGSVGVAWSEATEPNSVVVGIPLPAVDAEYYEVSRADELDRTLSTLGLALTVCAALTTLAGAMAGRVASQRLLAPLADVTSAAANVSAGDMNTRLPDTSDPDLSALVGAFNNMVDNLHDRIQRDARFAADVSHELRTPLTTLSTSLELLQQAPDLPVRADRAVQLIGLELERFRRALQDLLALGRLDSDTHDCQLSVVGIRELVHQALLADHRQPSLLIADGVGNADLLVRVDRSQIRRALTNLFRNADLHGGGLTGVRIVERGDFADVYVEDRGPGVPADDRARVFERFARAGGQKEGTGSGLGLSIVEQTVRNHRGAVWCADRAGGGAVFVLRLPLHSGVIP